MSVIVLADLRGKNGFVNKDTVAGGYGSRFTGDSFATRLGVHVRGIFQNVPSIHIGYLAAIFAAAGHRVIHTRDDRPVDGDLALVLTSLVDYRHEIEWGQQARTRGMKVGFFGQPATHLPELFNGAGDFVIQGANAAFDGTHVRYDKHHPDATMSWVDYGLSILTVGAVEHIASGGSADLADVLHDLGEAGHLAGYAAPRRFYEIGRPESLAELDHALRTGLVTP